LFGLCYPRAEKQVRLDRIRKEKETEWHTIFVFLNICSSAWTCGVLYWKKKILHVLSIHFFSYLRRLFSLPHKFETNPKRARDTTLEHIPAIARFFRSCEKNPSVFVFCYPLLDTVHRGGYLKQKLQFTFPIFRARENQLQDEVFF
jgi:hypothetical protein